MKFITNSRQLHQNLKKISESLPARSVLPIIENFLFDVQGNELEVTATNLEISMRSKMEIEGNGIASIAVPAKLMIDILGSLPEQPITIEVVENKMTMHASTGNYKLSCEDGKDFPELPEVPNELMGLPGINISDGLDKVLYAASPDQDKPALSSVYFVGDGSQMELVATDAHRLQRFTVSNDHLNPVDMLLPVKAASILHKIVGKQIVYVATDINNAYFQVDDTLLIARLVDQRYPNYQGVIPTENDKKLTVNKADILSALKRVKIFANKSTNQMKLVCDGSSTITLECVDPDFSNQATEKVDCDYDGTPITIGFNAQNLYDTISKVDTRDVVIELSAPNRAALVLPSESEGATDNLGLVMPIMLNELAYA